MKKQKSQAVRRSETTVGASILFFLTACPPVFAQCPDGTPPPCARPNVRPAAAAPAPDPNRIAVFPFRVTTADTLLGEGVAELLAAEFTGQGGPTATHMGTTLRAWRSAGGGPRAPLAQPDLIRAARGIGAGLAIEGSIVGLGQRLTVSASVVTVATGQARRVAPISGSADSLEMLLRRLTSGLLAVTGGQPNLAERGRLTDVPDAMRAYLEGLAAWRRYRPAPAAAAFERALGLDSGFAQAAFMRYQVAIYQVQNSARWAVLTHALRDRLSERDRILLTGYIGENYPTPRVPTQVVADRRRAVERMPDSPEALYALGDWLYHYGGFVNAGDRLEQARDLFVRSIALDTQATVLLHVMTIAAELADTTLARGIRGSYDALLSERWEDQWLAAARTGDRAWLATQRRRAEPGGAIYVIGYGASIAAPAALLDELARGVLDQATPAQRPPLLHVQAIAGSWQGRPAVAAQALAALSEVNRDGLVTMLALAHDADSGAASAAVTRLAAAALRDSAASLPLNCPVALWGASYGGVPNLDLHIQRARRHAEQCGLMAELLEARRAGAADFRDRLERADSLVRSRTALQWFQGFEHVMLARMWEQLGEPALALRAVRARNHGFGINWGTVLGPRLEGRYAAMAGDTAGAIRAYRRYLDLRRDAEPPFIAQRDSVRAELARLVRP